MAKNEVMTAFTDAIKKDTVSAKHIVSPDYKRECIAWAIQVHARDLNCNPDSVISTADKLYRYVHGAPATE